MKKGILWMLIIAMMVGACLPVSADKVTAAGEASAPVNGKYEASNQLGGIVFSVDLEWEGMEFTYHEEVPAVWDAEEYTYHAAIPAHWEGEGTITVTNHSNAVVRVVPSYEANVGFESAEMKFFPYRYLDRQSSTRRDGLWLHSAAIIGEADSGTITVTPSGTLPSTATETTQIGTLTVTLSAPELVWDDMDLDATLIDTEAGSLLTNSSDVVDSADSLPEGTQYILRADIQNVYSTLTRNCNYALVAYEKGNETWENCVKAYIEMINGFNALVLKTK